MCHEEISFYAGFRKPCDCLAGYATKLLLWSVLPTTRRQRKRWLELERKLRLRYTYPLLNKWQSFGKLFKQFPLRLSWLPCFTMRRRRPVRRIIIFLPNVRVAAVAENGLALGVGCWQFECHRTHRSVKEKAEPKVKSCAIFVRPTRVEEFPAPAGKKCQKWIKVILCFAKF